MVGPGGTYLLRTLDLVLSGYSNDSSTRTTDLKSCSNLTGSRSCLSLDRAPGVISVLDGWRGSGQGRDAKATRDSGVIPTPFWEIFGRAHLRRTVAAVVMATGIYGGAYVMITWLPTYLRTALNLSVATSAGYLAFNILGSLVGPFFYGWMSDRVGRRPAFMTFLVLQAANVAVYLLAPIGAAVTIVLSFFLGAFQAALASGKLPTFAELFPTNIRASGQGFCLGGGRGFGSIVPATVGLLAASLSLGTAMGTCALCAYAIAFCAAVFLPETSGADLHEASLDPAGQTDAQRPRASRALRT
jgi:MFS family permease